MEMVEIQDEQRRRLKRHPVTAHRDCSLGVIAFDNLEVKVHRARIVDLSATGIGIESDGPLDPGIIWFKDYVYGQKCGVLVWCRQNGVRYRAGIQFLSLNYTQEDYLRRQVEQSQPSVPLRDPDRVFASLMTLYRKGQEEYY